MGSFRSIGSITTGFNTSIAPGAPPGAQVGDILVAGFVQHAGSAAAPDLSSFGFTQKSDNATVKAAVLYTKTAAGGDTMPSANFGADFQCAFCAAYVNVTETLDRTSTQRGGNTTSGITIPSATAPPSDNVVAICLAMRNNTTATGVAISDYSPFTQRAANIPNANGRPLAVFQDCIMTTPQAIILGSQVTAPADGGANTCGSVIIFLQSIAAAFPVGDQEYPAVLPRVAGRLVHEFWQVPIQIRSIVPPAPLFSSFDSYQPQKKILPASLLGIQLNLLESTLRGQDRVLTGVDWDYSWDPPQLPVALRAENSPLTALHLTALTTYAPYIETNWPVPKGPAQWNRGFEHSTPLNLIGKDQILLSGPQNNMWDPPPGRKFPMALRGFESSGLALANTVQIKPPLSESSWPVPPRPRQPVQDWVTGMPQTILSFLTLQPPTPAPSEMPVRRRYSMAYQGFTHSILPFYAPVIPPIPGSGVLNEPRIPRIRFRSSLYQISESSPFLTPVTPPPPASSGQVAGPGGRTILLPKKQGETVTRPFDFISRLGANETILSATVFAFVYSGGDANPQSIVNGAAKVTGTIVYQSLTGGTTGVVYELLCKIVTSLGQTLEMAAFWVVEPDLP